MRLPLQPCHAEIATHTINHVASPNATQIIGARDWLIQVRRAVLSSIGLE